MAFNENSRVKIPAILHLMRMGYRYIPLKKQVRRNDTNIFATTGTNVSVLFLDKLADSEHIVLMDASKLGQTVKEGKNQRTVLSKEEEARIVETFNSKKAVEDLSVVVTKAQVQEKNYSFSAGQYFEVKIEYVDITEEEFQKKLQGFEERLVEMFAEGEKLDGEIMGNLKELRFGPFDSAQGPPSDSAQGPDSGG